MNMWFMIGIVIFLAILIDVFSMALTLWITNRAIFQISKSTFKNSLLFVLLYTVISSLIALFLFFFVSFFDSDWGLEVLLILVLLGFMFVVFDGLQKKFYATKTIKNLGIFLVMNLIGLCFGLIFSVFFVVPVRMYGFEFFQMSGPSMCPTLNEIRGECLGGKGELILVDKYTYPFIREPERQDIILYETHNFDGIYIKRIIGIPGDRIELKNGMVYVNNELLEEPYLSAVNQGMTVSYDQRFYELAEYEYFVLGDNRIQSLDSRKPEHGLVHRNQIVGKLWQSLHPLKENPLQRESDIIPNTKEKEIQKKRKK